MMRYLKILFLSLVVIGLMAGSAFAGSFTTFTPWKAAKEVVDGGTTAVPAVTNIGAKVTGIEYKPSDIPLGVLSDAVVTYTVSSGKLDGTGLQVCEGTTLIADSLSGSGTGTLVFQKGTGSGVVENGKTYKIQKKVTSNCDTGLVAADLTLTVPPGTSSTTLTTKSGVAATQVIHDTASAALVSVIPEFKASLSLKADQKISPAEGFKKFTGPATTDAITIKIEKETVDFATTTAGGDVTTIKLALTDVSGLATTSVASTEGFACTLSLTTKIATCTKTAAAAPVEPIITFTVDGITVLAERTFTATNEIDFATAGMKDRTVANDFALLKDADAGKWVYDATKVYLPLIGTNPAEGRETYIKLQSTETTTVKAIVLASDGSTVVVDLGTITAGTPKTITGEDLKNLVTAAGKSVDGVAGFAAVLSVTAAKENIYGYANIIDPFGAKRVPLSIESGVSN